MNLNITLSEFKRLQHLDYKEWLEVQREINISDHNTLEFLQVWKPKIGLFSGSFKPMHIGHLNIIEKAERIFDKVIIVYGNNPEKENESYAIPETIKNRQIIRHDGLLTDLIKKIPYDVTLIRGLRNSNDLQFELTQYKYLQDLMPEIKTVNIFCDREFEHISSSSIRTLLKFGTGHQYILK